MQSSGFTHLLVALGKAVSNASDLLGNADDFQELLAGLGWSATDLPASYQALAGSANALRTRVQALADSPSYDDLLPIIDSIRQLVLAIENLQDAPAGLDTASFLPVFKQQLLNVLLVTGSRNYLPVVYYLFKLLGIISPSSNLATNDHDAYQNETFRTDTLADLLQRPTETLGAQLGWGQGFTFGADMQQNLLGLLNAVGVNALLLSGSTAAASDDPGPADPNDPERNKLRLPLIQQLSSTLQEAMTTTLDTVSVVTETDLLSVIEDEDLPDSGDVPLFVSTQDELSFSLLSHLPGSAPINLTSNLLLDLVALQGLSNALTFVVSPDGLRFANAAGNPLTTLSLDPAVTLTYTPDTPLILMGQPGKTRLQVEGLQLALSLKASGSERSVKLTLQTVNSQLIIDGSEGDSFLSNVLPDSTIAVPLSVTLSSLDGLRFNGANKFQLKTSPNRNIGPVLFKQVTLGLDSTAEHDVAIRAHSDLEISLGPVTVSASDVGVSFTIKEISNPKDIVLGFDLPKGLGIDVDSDLVTGGGYLFLDPAHHQYAGAATLKLKLGKKDINLNALGLLQTELPGNPDAYSLLLLITATFTPIELGLGFTLNGLGGLLGVNRAANTTYLRGLVRGGQLDTLLFPTNVMDNPAAALATIDAAFPATEGRYIIGLLGELGWGVPVNLITLDVALLVELPSPVRLLILGVLQASLPSKTNELLKLRADFLGSIDFGAKKVAFDAALSESKILVYSLTGDMAFRLYQGDNPVFLISAGGFHPQFQPPAGADLPPLRRLTLALAQGSDLRLTLASYFAVTSNTVQFGAHLDLYLNLRLGLQAEGHFGLDSLFQFKPFRLLAHVDAGVSIKRGNSELLGLHLSLDVTGPGPWHVWGEASFKIWFVKISVDVNATIGDKPNGVPIAAPDVRTPLLAALSSAAAWTVEAPATAQPGGVVLRPASVAADQVFLDPRGTLVISQRVAPLGLELARYGNGAVAPTGGNRFNLLSLTVGTTPYPATDADHVEVVRDFFAPDQFQNLTDGDRLSLPSFQLQPNGLRLKGLSHLTAGATPTATRRVVQYERLLREGAATGTVSGGSLTPLAFGRLARGGALGQRYQAAQPSARAAQPIGWAETTYAVVQAADLTVYQGQDKIGSQAEAEQYRRAQPTAADLLVVPTYQLELA